LEFVKINTNFFDENTQNSTKNLRQNSTKSDKLSDSTKRLREQVNLRLPKVGLVEMIREVDSWVNYTNELRDGDASQNSERDSLLYAALMSNGCNIPLADLARSSDLDYQALWWVANNHFSDENVKNPTILSSISCINNGSVSIGETEHYHLPMGKDSLPVAKYAMQLLL